MAWSLWRTVWWILRKLHVGISWQHFYLWSCPLRNKNLHSHKILDMNIESSSIPNGLKLEKVGKWIKTLVHHTTEYCTTPKRTKLAACNNLESSPGNYAEWILFKSQSHKIPFYLMLLKWQDYIAWWRTDQGLAGFKTENSL